jgi:RNA polymerase sigma-70 factor (ECF subfamily)
VARADLYCRLGELDEACAHYKRPLALARQEPVRRFLVRRLQELNG